MATVDKDGFTIIEKAEKYHGSEGGQYFKITKSKMLLSEAAGRKFADKDSAMLCLQLAYKGTYYSGIKLRITSTTDIRKGYLFSLKSFNEGSSNTGKPLAWICATPSRFQRNDSPLPLGTYYNLSGSPNIFVLDESTIKSKHKE